MRLRLDVKSQEELCPLPFHSSLPADTRPLEHHTDGRCITRPRRQGVQHPPAGTCCIAALPAALWLAGCEGLARRDKDPTVTREPRRRVEAVPLKPVPWFSIPASVEAVLPKPALQSSHTVFVTL